MGIDPISIGLEIAGVGASIFGGFQAADAQNKAQQARQRMSDLQTQKQRLDQIREARIARAKVLQAGANQGAGNSSSVTTGASGVYGQAESNINYINEESNIGHAINQAQQEQLNAAGLTKIGADLQGFAGVVADNKHTIQSIFGS